MSVLGKKNTNTEKTIDKKDGEVKKSVSPNIKEIENWANKNETPVAVKKVGRQPSKNPKKKRVILYLTDEEYVKLFEKSRQVGLNPTSFIVSRLLYGER